MPQPDDDASDVVDDVDDVPDDPPPPPPPPPQEVEAGRPVHRRKPEADKNGRPYYDVGGGYICWNAMAGTFEATCKERCHHNATNPCRATRTSEGVKRGAVNLARGRPLGFLVAWLRYGVKCLDRCSLSFFTLHEQAARVFVKNVIG